MHSASLFCVKAEDVSTGNSQTHSAHLQGRGNARGKEKVGFIQYSFKGLMHVHGLFFLLCCLDDPLEKSG